MKNFLTRLNNNIEDIFIRSNNDEIPSKYYVVRDQIENGDIILYHGNSFLAKCIQYFDNAKYNHVGIIWKYEDRLFTLDMWSNGLTLTPLSNRIKGYKDFCILRPKKVSLKKIQYAINNALIEWEGNVKYDKLLLLRIAIIKKTGIDVSGLGEEEKFICSEFAQDYTSKLGINTYENIKLITPEDLLRYVNPKELEVFFNDKK